MSMRYDCRDPQARTAGIDAAVTAARGGELIVLPTDTVYGIGADAFTPAAVTAMLAAKGRGRNMPPPVLVGTARAAAALAEDLGAFGQDLIDEFWPGALTLVFRASPTLLWDLGDTKGTVALRMPLHSVALDVLKQTGPLAVSSANRHGQPPAVSAGEAEQQFGEAVSVYLDGGPCADQIPSTILDLTGTVPKVLRAGAISVDRLRAVASVIAENEHYAESAGPTADHSAADLRPADRSAHFKPAAPHPLENSGGSLDPATGEPPAGA
jgi:tRNA threonylcarbamoyl adenosine modification protein (Sua5/YciO/YrdC/YwlC family)